MLRATVTRKKKNPLIMQKPDHTNGAFLGSPFQTSVVDTTSFRTMVNSGAQLANQSTNVNGMFPKCAVTCITEIYVTVNTKKLIIQ